MNRRARLLCALVFAFATACGPKPAHETAPAIPRIPLPPIHRSTLKNGLRVVIVEDHELPIARASLSFRVAGATTIPAGRTGVRAMALDLLREGTKTRSAEQIALAIDGVGGTLATAADDESAQIAVAVLVRDLPMALALMAECTLSPSFPPEELEEERRLMIASVKSSFDDPGSLADMHRDALAWGAQHPFAIRATEETLAAITREDVIRYHHDWFAPKGATLVITGDVNETILAAVERDFGAWDGPEPHQPAMPPPVMTRRIRVVNDPELTQSFVSIALPGPLRGSPEWHAARLAEAIVSNGFSSRLTKVVRTRAGKTYSVDGSFAVWPKAGVFELTTSTRTEETAATISLVLEELTKAADGTEPITATELTHAKAYILGAYPRSFETGADVTAKLLFAEEYGLPIDELTDYRGRLARVTLAEVNACARKWLNPRTASAGPVIVVVGNAAEIRDALSKALKDFGTVEVVSHRSPVRGS